MNVKRMRLTQVVDGSVDLALRVEDVARQPLENGRPHPSHADVTAKDGVVHLAGRIDSLDAFHEIERTVRAIPGVRDTSTVHLRRMGPTDTRPSDGAAGRRSKALRELLKGVNALDIGDEEDARRLVGAILAVFLRTLPDDPQRHFETHLPADVRALMDEALIVGALERPRSMDEFLALVADAAGPSGRRNWSRGGSWPTCGTWSRRRPTTSPLSSRATSRGCGMIPCTQSSPERPTRPEVLT